MPMSLRERTRPGLGIIEPCLPSPAKAPPSGPGWLHEIKHDGFRILARKDAAGVRLITRAGKFRATQIGVLSVYDLPNGRKDNAQKMDRRGIGPGACVTGRPSLGTAARSNHCDRL